MSSKKIAVVTGGNKGIGYGIVKNLCEKFEGEVYLTARDEEKGRKAVEELKKLGHNPLFHQLDITDQASVDKFRDYLKEHHGKIDVLVNNAGINTGPDHIGDKAEKVVDVNYFGTLRVCEALFPLLNNSSKVVNVSSSSGHLFEIPLKRRNQFSDPQLTIPKLSQLMRAYVKDYKNHNLEAEGWPKSSYALSKVGVNALSIIQQRNFDNETPNRNIMLNYVHPGGIKTDMNRMGGMTVEQGAKSTIYAIFSNLKGKYIWWDCQIVDWYSPDLPPKSASDMKLI